MNKFNKNRKIFQLSKNELESIIKDSKNFKEVLLKLKYTPNGSQYKNLKKKCLDEQIDITHLDYRPPSIHQPIDYYLKKDFYVSSKFLKDKLVKLGMLDYKCSNKKCNISDSWLESQISLHLDHINGDNSDNTIKNLRLLCPNCHSQTETYSGRNRNKNKFSDNLLNFSKEIKVKKDKLVDCKTCTNRISKVNKTGKCYTCYDNDKKQKRIDIVEKIKDLIGKETLDSISKKINISSRRLSKILIMEKIDYPKNKYWGLINGEKYKQAYLGKPDLKKRKYDYKKVYNSYLKNKSSYAKTAKKLQMSRSQVRDIVISHINYLNNQKK